MRSFRSHLWSWRVLTAALTGWVVVDSTHVLAQGTGSAPAVQVALRFDRANIAVGETTLLRVTAEIAPGLKPSAAQIFSWHLDLLAEFAAPVEWQPGKVERPASDRDPLTSSIGIVDGAVLRGVYDTFVARPDAGRTAPVELFSIPIVGMRDGTASFRVRPGTGPGALSGDFLVAGVSADATWSGGDYSSATASIQVGGVSAEGPVLAIRFEPAPSGVGGTVVLEFNAVSGRTYVVQTTEALGEGAVWRDLAGAPHQTGRVTENLAAGARFYRVVQR